MWDKVTYLNWEIIYRKSNSYSNIKNHEHQDYLHFTVNYMGHPILIDSGLASYMDNHCHAKARNAEYHNSVLIDGHAYKPIQKKIFPDDYYSNSVVSEKIKTTTGYKIILKTSGFNRIDNAISFERHIVITEKSLAIVDNSNSKNDHQISNYFHFDNNLQFMNNPRFFKFSLNNTMIEFINYSHEISNSNLNICSKQYGTTELKKVLNSINIININNPITHRMNII
jgi:hypothetical protein